jgi:hypothetical protein
MPGRDGELLDMPLKAAVDSAGGQEPPDGGSGCPATNHHTRTDTTAMDLTNARIAFRLAPMGADGDGRSVPWSG